MKIYFNFGFDKTFESKTLSNNCLCFMQTNGIISNYFNKNIYGESSCSCVPYRYMQCTHSQKSKRECGELANKWFNRRSQGCKDTEWMQKLLKIFICKDVNNLFHF